MTSRCDHRHSYNVELDTKFLLCQWQLNGHMLLKTNQISSGKKMCLQDKLKPTGQNKKTLGYLKLSCFLKRHN